MKGITQNKPRLGQGGAGIRRKMKIPSTPQLSKPIQLTSNLTSQHPESTAQPKIFCDSRPQTKYILIPQTSSGMQAKPKMISREIPNYPNPIYRPLPKTSGKTITGHAKRNVRFGHGN